MKYDIETKGIIIPHDRLSQTALQGLIEEFVTRDGTDTGYMDGSLEKRVEMVMRLLIRGDVFFVYDEDTQTAMFQRNTPSPFHTS
jgi:uncharacterized protein YheU (UPF0270 family)